MVIAVTGSSGFIGYHLCNKLKELKYNIIPIDLRNGIDLENWKDVNKITGFNILIHLAAKSFVPDSFEDPRSFYYSNLNCTLNALELCRKCNAKMVYTSSYVYGNPKRIPTDENQEVTPFNPYAQSKLIGEQLCEGYNKFYKIPIIILRPFNIYGKGQSKNFIIPSIITKAKTGKVHLRDPSPRRDLLYIDDIIDAYISTIDYYSDNVEIFNIGSGVNYSIDEIVDIISRSMTSSFEVYYTGDKRKNEVIETRADITRARSLLNWQPKYNLIQGIKSMIQEE
jgi:UDP-glucose 4-epimerase